MELRPWRLSRMLTFTRTAGQVGMRKNGTQLDIWVRVDGRSRWFSINQKELRDFLASGSGPFQGHGDEIVLYAESEEE